MFARAGGFGVAALGHWQLVAALAWLTTARAACAPLALLGLGGGILAVAPYVSGAMPAAPVSIQAIAYLAATELAWWAWFEQHRGHAGVCRRPDVTGPFADE